MSDISRAHGSEYDCLPGGPAEEDVNPSHRIKIDTRIAPGTWECQDCSSVGIDPRQSPESHAEAHHRERWGVGVVVVADEAHRGSEGS